MKKIIYKYPLQVTDSQEVKLPAGAVILSVQAQGGNPCLWAMVNPVEKKPAPVTIKIFGTGHPIETSAPDKLKYISTFQLQGGSFVGHVFQLI